MDFSEPVQVRRRDVAVLNASGQVLPISTLTYDAELHRLVVGVDNLTYNRPYSFRLKDTMTDDALNCLDGEFDGQSYPTGNGSAGGDFAVAFIEGKLPQATVNLNTPTPGTKSLLTATATKSDPDGHPVSLTFVWKVNGEAKRTFTSSVASSDNFDLGIAGNGDHGDTIAVEVTPTAESRTGETVTDMATVVNAGSVAESLTVTTDEDTSASVTLSATDIDDDSLSYRIVVPPQHGTLSGAESELTYTPEANWSGSDAFTYVANDGTVDSNEATVSIAVNTINDPPVASNDSFTVDEDTVLSVDAPGVLSNDSDLDLGAFYADTVRADNPWAYWRLGELSGAPFADASGNNRTLTAASGDPEYGQAGPLPGDPDTAVRFDGENRGFSSDILSGPAYLEGASEFTIKAWIRLESVNRSESHIILEEFSWTGTSQWLHLFAVSNDGILAYANRSSQGQPDGSYPPIGVTSTKALTAGEWHHVAVTVGTEDSVYGARLYIDGESDGTYLGGNWTIANPWGGSSQSWLGGMLDHWYGHRVSCNLYGSLDEVAIYRTNLSAAQMGPSRHGQACAILVDGPVTVR